MQVKITCLRGTRIDFVVKEFVGFRVSIGSFLWLLVSYTTLANIMSRSQGDSMIVTVTGGGQWKFLECVNIVQQGSGLSKFLGTEVI